MKQWYSYDGSCLLNTQSEVNTESVRRIKLLYKEMSEGYLTDQVWLLCSLQGKERNNHEDEEDKESSKGVKAST